jgi:hypothetical protein
MVNARVLSAQPIVQPVPMSGCQPPSGAGAGIGAVTGGLIGSQVGRGNGHIAGAILGAVGGAFLGNAAEASQPGRCGTRYDQRVTGYDVIYEYGGRQYRTRTAQAPGQWLQVPSPDAYPSPDQPAYGDAGDAQGYPVQPPPPPQAAAYPAPSYPYPAGGDAPEAPGVVTAPPPAAYNNGYPYPPPQPYPYAYPQPAYPGYYPGPVYVRPAPRYVAPPVGVNLSVGGMVGRRTAVGVGVGF